MFKKLVKDSQHAQCIMSLNNSCVANTRFSTACSLGFEIVSSILWFIATKPCVKVGYLQHGQLETKVFEQIKAQYAHQVCKFINNNFVHLQWVDEIKFCIISWIYQSFKNFNMCFLVATSDICQFPRKVSRVRILDLVMPRSPMSKNFNVKP